MYRKFKDVLDDEKIGNALGKRDHDKRDVDYHDLLAEVSFFPIGDSPNECKFCQENFSYYDSVVDYIRAKKFRLAHSLLKLHQSFLYNPDKLVRSMLKRRHDENDSHWHEFAESLVIGWADVLHDLECGVCYDIREKKACLLSDTE